MGEVQSEASEVKEKEKVKASEEPELSTKDLLKVISTQNEQLLKQGEEITNIKDHFNKLVDAFSELGDKLEKGAGAGGGGKGSLAEIAMLLKAVAPLMRGSESDPFRDIGVYTFKQFLRSSMGKKGSKKIMEDIFKEKKEEKEE